jgi:hypothetical protein
MPPPDPLALAMNRPMPLDPNDPTAFMRSIIDAQGRQQIWDTMGGFASGLLQSAAPSPVPRDFGSVFGAGIQGALQGQRGGEDSAIKRAMTATQLMQATGKLADDKQWREMFGGGAPGGSQADQAANDRGGWARPTVLPGVTATPGAPAPTAGGQGGYGSAIAGIETTAKPGGGYDLIGPVADDKGSRAHGRYQVMDYNIGPWTQEVLGQAMTPDQFRASPQAQDAVFNAKFGQLLKQYGNPQDAASAWFSGKPLAQAGQARDVNGMTPQRYVEGFNSGLPPGASGAPPLQPAQYTPPGGPLQQPGQPPVGAAPTQAKTIAQVVQGLPPGVRQIIGVMGREKGLPELLKYVDPDSVPAIDAQTGQVVFAPKTELGSGRYVPIDAQRLALEMRREQREGLNAKVVPGAGGVGVPNAPLLAFDRGVSEAQGTDPASKIMVMQAEDAVKRNSEWQKNGLQAQSAIGQLGVLQNLLDQISTGRFTGTTTDIKAAAKAAGINLEGLGITDNVAPAQAFSALTKLMALDNRRSMPGPMSDGDRFYLNEAAPSITKDPAGNRILIGIMRGDRQREIDTAKYAREYISSPKFKTNPEGLDEYVTSRIMAKNYYDPALLPQRSAAPAGEIPAPAPAPAPTAAPKIRRFNPDTGKIE